MRKSPFRAIGGALAWVPLIMLLSVTLACRPSMAAAFSGEVVGVHDGDTVTVLRDGAPVRVRLACIDAPEKSQAFGGRAKRALSELIMRRAVWVQEVDTDVYGRLVARLATTEGDVSLALVEEGLAWHYAYHCPEDRQLAEAQAQARAARRGLWRDADPIPPWDFRRRR